MNLRLVILFLFLVTSNYAEAQTVRIKFAGPSSGGGGQHNTAIQFNLRAWEVLDLYRSYTTDPQLLSSLDIIEEHLAITNIEEVSEFTTLPNCPIPDQNNGAHSCFLYIQLKAETWAEVSNDLNSGDFDDYIFHEIAQAAGFIDTSLSFTRLFHRSPENSHTVVLIAGIDTQTNIPTLHAREAITNSTNQSNFCDSQRREQEEARRNLLENRDSGIYTPEAFTIVEQMLRNAEMATDSVCN